MFSILKLCEIFKISVYLLVDFGLLSLFLGICKTLLPNKDVVLKIRSICLDLNMISAVKVSARLSNGPFP